MAKRSLDPLQSVLVAGAAATLRTAVSTAADAPALLAFADALGDGSAALLVIPFMFFVRKGTPSAGQVVVE